MSGRSITSFSFQEHSAVLYFSKSLGFLEWADGRLKGRLVRVVIVVVVVVVVVVIDWYGRLYLQ